jgi:hypothetical protein
MQLEATLPLGDLSALIDQLVPLQIMLGEDSGAYLLLTDPTSVALVPATGLRVACSAKLSWPVLGISVPVVLNALSILLRPTVTRRADGLVLVFHVEVEQIDLALLPNLIDLHVTDKVNRELRARQVELVWDFTNTLSHSFPLPRVLASADTFALSVLDGVVDIDEQALHFVVSFQAEVTRWNHD